VSNASWYVLYVRPTTKDGKPKKMAFPLVGKKLVHKLGSATDDEKLNRDKKSPLWDKIQDGDRPAWAPDILRLGYAIVFRRDGLPKLAVKLGIQDPAKMKTQGKGTGKQRALSFDDVWVVGLNPSYTPFVMPSTNMKAEEWWSKTKDTAPLASPYVAPGGGEIVVGAQRLSDVVRSMLSTPSGYPRPVPGLEQSELDSLAQLVNPTLPRLPTIRDEPDQPGYTGDAGSFAGVRLFRY
jgi:hypothetical protein